MGGSLEIKPAFLGKKIGLEVAFLKVLRNVEQYCKDQGLSHRFVGGTVTDFIGPETKFEIDIAKKKLP